MDGEITLSSLPCVCVCAERAQATEQRYNKLKEKHTELVASHAELLRKVHAHCIPRSGKLAVNSVVSTSPRVLLCCCHADRAQTL